jgi:hypothetical protein
MMVKGYEKSILHFPISHGDMFLLTTLQQGKWMARNMVTDMIEHPV